MPVLTDTRMNSIHKELENRYGTLLDVTCSRSLRSDREGAGKGRWRDPEKMSATVGNASEIRMACDDFKTILSEIRRLK